MMEFVEESWNEILAKTVEKKSVGMIRKIVVKIVIFLNVTGRRDGGICERVQILIVRDRSGGI